MGRLGFLSVLCLLLFCGCTSEPDENPTVTACPGCRNNFSVKNYRLEHVKDGLTPFKLTASELSRRQRMGRIFKFVDHDELYLKQLLIEQALPGKIVKFDISPINPVAPLNEELPATSQTTGQQPIARTAASGLANTLSRVLVDDFSIHFQPDKKQPIVLTAKQARMLTDTQVIRFDGEFTVNAAKCKISADLALWSNLHNGLFFPDVYRLNHNTYDKPAFYRISDTGRCHQVHAIGMVEYIDQLDSIEDKVMETMPGNLRLIFGLVGMPN